MLEKANTKTSLLVRSESLKDENQCSKKDENQDFKFKDSKSEESFLSKKRKKSGDKNGDERDDLEPENLNNKKPKLSDNISGKHGNIDEFNIK